MSILDDLPSEIAEALDDVFRSATLKIPGEGTGDGQGGTITGDPTTYSCRALVDDFSDFRRSALGIPGTDRRIILLAATLPSGVRPAVGHAITAEGRDWSIVAVTRDPAAATYEIQGR